MKTPRQGSVSIPLSSAARFCVGPRHRPVRAATSIPLAATRRAPWPSQRATGFWDTALRVSCRSNPYSGCSAVGLPERACRSAGLALVSVPRPGLDVACGPLAYSSRRASKVIADIARITAQPCGGFLQGRPSGKAVLVGCWLGSDELGDRVVEVEVARLGQELVVPVAEGGLQLGIEPDSRARRWRGTGSPLPSCARCLATDGAPGGRGTGRPRPRPPPGRLRGTR
jgi:hypothetical protein